MDWYKKYWSTSWYYRYLGWQKTRANRERLIRNTLEYQSIGRRLFMVDSLPEFRGYSFVENSFVERPSFFELYVTLKKDRYVNLIKVISR